MYEVEVGKRAGQESVVALPSSTSWQEATIKCTQSLDKLGTFEHRSSLAFTFPIICWYS